MCCCCDLLLLLSLVTYIGDLLLWFSLATCRRSAVVVDVFMVDVDVFVVVVVVFVVVVVLTADL